MKVGDRIGPYRLLEVIERETSRATSRYIACRAEDKAWAHKVALEVSQESDVGDGDRMLFRMSLDEARFGVTLVHRNVARLYDLGIDGRHMFVATEHVPGATLAELQGRVPLDIAIAIACEVCAGLHYLHNLVTSDGKSFEVVHGAVAPDTVHVGCDGSVKLRGGRYLRMMRDWRHASMRRDDFLYLSPEQCLGQPIDHRSDIYALARVVWELTTGAPMCLPALSEFDVLTQIARHDPQPPSEVMPDYPRELERIVLRALQRVPAARYATADQFQVELETFARTHQRYASARDIARFMREAVPERAARASCIP
jgi:eukaryotic-like serine/threonine-protein kinase